MTNGCQIQNQRTKSPWGHKNPKNDIWRHQNSLTSDDLGWPWKGHNVSVNHGCHLATPIHVLVHITSKNTEVRKFQALKRCGTQISLDMTLEIRSQDKGHSRYGHNFIQDRCKIVQRLGMPSVVTIGRSVKKKNSWNVWLGGVAGSEPSLSNRHSLLCWPSPHHPIAQFQCHERSLSESLTCLVDWTRSPSPTHALWPLCGSCHWNTHPIMRRGKVWPSAPGLEPGSHHRH